MQHIYEKIKSILQSTCGNSSDMEVIIEKIENAYNTESYLITLPSHQYILKMAYRQSDHDGIVNSIETTNLLIREGIRVPKVSYYNSNELIEKRPFFLQEWIPGKDLGELLEKNEPSKLEQRIILKRVGTSLSRVHKITNNFFGKVHGDVKFNNWEDYLHFDLEESLRKNKEKGTLNDRFLKNISDYLSPKFKDLYTGRPCLTHLDLHPPNILVHTDGEVGLIDFELSKFGDPIRDFIKLELTLFERFKHLRKCFFKGYGNAWIEERYDERMRIYMIMEYLSAISYFSDEEPSLVKRYYDNLKSVMGSAT